MIPCEESFNDDAPTDHLCDLCHQPLEHEDNSFEGPDGWEYNITYLRYAIDLQSGDPFNAFWEKEEHEYQCCLKCFETKIKPLFTKKDA